MEPVIYEKDFGSCTESHLGDCPEAASIQKLRDAGFFRFQNALVRRLPKVAVSEGKVTYERLLSACERKAKQHGGKIQSILDPELGEAEIRLSLPFAEFTFSQDLQLLQDLAEHTLSVCFTPSGDGTCVVMTTVIHYFDIAPLDRDNLDHFSALIQAAAEETGYHLPSPPERMVQLLQLFLEQNML